MASHQRQPGRPSGAASASATLPPYQQPSHPLSMSAQQALTTLSNTVSLAKLKAHYAKIETLIPKGAGEVNDVLYTRQEQATQRKARRARKGLEEEGTDEELEETKETIEGMTRKMEAAMRKAIDGRVIVEDIEEGVQYLRQNALRLTQAESQTQLTQRSQQRRKGRRSGKVEGSGEDDEDEEMADDEEYDSPGPTPLNMEGIEITGPSKMFKNRLQEKKDKWQVASHSARYAENNSYIGFRQIVHDAQHPGGDILLPHASTWFTERGEPALGVTVGATAGEDDDDDVMIAKDTISTKCPLTLREFKDPVSSRKCPHSFEKEAIMGMINGSGARLGTGQKVVQCPVSGCDKMLCAADLKVNPVLLRVIERLRKAKDQASDDEDDVDATDRPSGSSMQRADTNLASRARSRMPEQEPPQSSIVLDLGGSDDSDETEEE
ncbi:uncharacterized protein BDZ99DRAFT_451749 [Mytilinidion resinicola]|uniref:SP-RING-type domain-containing protein n=1 Tax=Mytilinidion resinicola TaxID=574789 RepID=A0A6A6Y726_9PEZI|nr:uncharacterized protein BDZ99DRAFT_451749 [Mytilinidion resinicola]KAF2804631.1 hypothetical protein BDZ99DRAFT_451749 [Mytilinidion resinicola]